jgi:hypothetical protein
VELLQVLRDPNNLKGPAWGNMAKHHPKFKKPIRNMGSHMAESSRKGGINKISPLFPPNLPILCCSVPFSLPRLSNLF